MSETTLTPPQRTIMRRLVAEYAGAWRLDAAPQDPPKRATLDRLVELGLVMLEMDGDAVTAVVATDKAKTMTFPIDPGSGRPSTFKPAFAELAAAMGGVEKLVEKLGTTLRSLQRWSAGTVLPSKLVQNLMRQIADEHGIATRFPWES